MSIGAVKFEWIYLLFFLLSILITFQKHSQIDDTNFIATVGEVLSLVSHNTT